MNTMSLLSHPLSFRMEICSFVGTACQIQRKKRKKQSTSSSISESLCRREHSTLPWGPCVRSFNCQYLHTVIHLLNLKWQKHKMKCITSQSYPKLTLLEGMTLNRIQQPGRAKHSNTLRTSIKGLLQLKWGHFTDMHRRGKKSWCFLAI